MRSTFRSQSGDRTRNLRRGRSRSDFAFDDLVIALRRGLGKPPRLFAVPRALLSHAHSALRADRTCLDRLDGELDCRPVEADRSGLECRRPIPPPHWSSWRNRCCATAERARATPLPFENPARRCAGCGRSRRARCARRSLRVRAASRAWCRATACSGRAATMPAMPISVVGSSRANRISCSRSPGRMPVNVISMSRPGSRPDRRMMRSARSTIFTGCPMLST